MSGTTFLTINLAMFILNIALYALQFRRARRENRARRIRQMFAEPNEAPVEANR